MPRTAHAAFWGAKNWFADQRINIEGDSKETRPQMQTEELQQRMLKEPGEKEGSDILDGQILQIPCGFNLGLRFAMDEEEGELFLKVCGDRSWVFLHQRRQHSFGWPELERVTPGTSMGFLWQQGAAIVLARSLGRRRRSTRAFRWMVQIGRQTEVDSDVRKRLRLCGLGKMTYVLRCSGGVPRLLSSPSPTPATQNGAAAADEEKPNSGHRKLSKIALLLHPWRNVAPSPANPSAPANPPKPYGICKIRPSKLSQPSFSPGSG
ncbi:hypothetical protein ACLOJK_004887 [Asimina triloba]